MSMAIVEEALPYYHMGGTNRGFTIDRWGTIHDFVPPPEVLPHVDGNPTLLIGKTWEADNRLIRFTKVCDTNPPSPSPPAAPPSTGSNTTSSSNQQQELLITLYMGGTWSKQKYVVTEGSSGSRIEKRRLKIPLTSSLSDLTYSELIDHVKRESGSFGDEKLTYKSSKMPCVYQAWKKLALSIENEWNMKPFLDHVAELLASSKPVNLYLG